MIKVMFVCLGNICRSPMAKFIFIDMLKKRGLEDKFIVDSSATSNSEVGNGLYNSAQKKLMEKNIKCEGHFAKQLKKEDYEKYDYILGMEDRNVDNILRIVGKNKNNKVCRLLDFSNSPRDISDPWYTGDFEKAYNDIHEGCENLLNHIMAKMDN